MNNREELIALLGAYVEEPSELTDVEYNRLTIYGAHAFIEALADFITEQTRLAREDTIIKLMSVRTEGLFDNGELFIKRAPIEQAIIDLIGYEKYKAIMDSLPPAQLAPKPEKGPENG